MYAGMSELYREWNDLHAAAQALLRSRDLGEFAGFPQNRYRWRVAMARIHAARSTRRRILTSVWWLLSRGGHPYPILAIG